MYSVMEEVHVDDAGGQLSKDQVSMRVCFSIFDYLCALIH